MTPINLEIGDVLEVADLYDFHRMEGVVRYVYGDQACVQVDDGPTDFSLVVIGSSAECEYWWRRN